MVIALLTALWACLTALLPVLLFVAGMTLVALILDAALSNDGKW